MSGTPTEVELWPRFTGPDDLAAVERVPLGAAGAAGDHVRAGRAGGEALARTCGRVGAT